MNEDYFEQIKTISAQSLAFVRYHSAMTRSTHNERSPPVPTILELNSVLIQERQKHDALIHIWNELVRFNQEQASAQRVSRTAAHTADRTGRALCSSLSKQSKTHRVLKRRNQGHGVSSFFKTPSALLANFRLVLNWLNLRMRLFVVIVATVLKPQNGVVARTALEHFVTPVVYIMQNCLDEWATLRSRIMLLDPSLKGNHGHRILEWLSQWNVKDKLHLSSSTPRSKCGPLRKRLASWPVNHLAVAHRSHALSEAVPPSN